MTILNNAKKTPRFILVLLLCCLMVVFQNCKKKRSEMASILYKKTHNKVFKDIDPDEFARYFQKALKKEHNKMSNPQLIFDHYDQDDYEPVFTINHLWNGDL